MMSSSPRAQESRPLASRYCQIRPGCPSTGAPRSIPTIASAPGHPPTRACLRALFTRAPRMLLAGSRAAQTGRDVSSAGFPSTSPSPSIPRQRGCLLARPSDAIRLCPPLLAAPPLILPLWILDVSTPSQTDSSRPSRLVRPLPFRNRDVGSPDHPACPPNGPRVFQPLPDSRLPTNPLLSFPDPRLRHARTSSVNVRPRGSNPHTRRRTPIRAITLSPLHINPQPTTPDSRVRPGAHGSSLASRPELACTAPHAYIRHLNE